MGIRCPLKSSSGFLSLGIMGYAALAAGVVILGLSVALKWQTSRLESAQIAKAQVEGEYLAFKTGVERLGREAEAKAKATVAKQEKINHDRYNALRGRYADIAARYDRLRQSAGIGSGSRPMPAVPDTARPTDDSARDSRLLEVLRGADQQTATLIELQEWVKAQSRP